MSNRKATTADVNIFMRTDLYHLGYGECGEEIAGETAYILAEACNGKRWVYKETWNLTRKYHDEDGFLHGVRDKAHEVAADAVLKHLQETLISDGLWIDGGEDWEPTSPCYGSESWTQEDEIGLMDDAEYAAYIRR